MLLQKHNQLHLYDIRSVINISRIKEEKTIYQLKSITQAKHIEFAKETYNTMFSDDFDKVSYHGILNYSHENFSGGLYSFRDAEAAEEDKVAKEYIRPITIDISPGYLLLFNPDLYIIKKHRIDNNSDDTCRHVIYIYK